jgi:DNA-binding transcriptional ArsR family regulator
MAADIFEALAEPTRRRIVIALREGDRPVGELADELQVSQPSISKHLRALREAGLVQVRPDAQRRLYGLRPEPLRELAAWLEPLRQVWADRLDALEAQLDEMED